MGGAPIPRIKCRSACLCVLRICAHVSSTLLRVTFPIILSHFAFAFSCEAAVVLNCHLGSQIRIFAPDGVGRAS